VQQYQRFFSDADRVLILLHNDPDPDAMASGLALRNVLRRNRSDRGDRGAAGGDATRKPADAEPARHPGRNHHVGTARRLRSHRDGGRPAALLRRSLPPASTWSSIITPSSPATARCSRIFRANYGSTSTILTEHLRPSTSTSPSAPRRRCSTRSSRTRSSFNRQANRVDLEAFSPISIRSPTRR